MSNALRELTGLQELYLGGTCFDDFCCLQASSFCFRPSEISEMGCLRHHSV